MKPTMPQALFLTLLSISMHAGEASLSEGLRGSRPELTAAREGRILTTGGVQPELLARYEPDQLTTFLVGEGVSIENPGISSEYTIWTRFKILEKPLSNYMRLVTYDENDDEGVYLWDEDYDGDVGSVLLVDVIGGITFGETNAYGDGEFLQR